MASLFTKIVNGEIPAWKVAEDENFLAFLDIFPVAKGHTLVIPKKELVSLEDLTSEDQMMVGHIYMTIQKIARSMGFAEAGYRVVVNCRDDGGQEVPHLHFHLLAGRGLKWPPG